eukprot:TRINITY_DN64_c0_g1_i1.p1 TRINITY_DN64_c0_g1~~TRINITY_DN64_c0_g1_i1.p1  ORF type:complete len:217 (-),score=41.16 TRINITY_DN64_c0_g1_i1:68-688(-)
MKLGSLALFGVLVALFAASVSADTHTIWTSQFENGWGSNFFGGSGKDADDIEMADGTPSIFFQVIWNGGVSFFHPYTYVDSSPWANLTFKFFWSYSDTNFTFQVQIKQEPETWSNNIPVPFADLKRGEWNTITMPIASFNLTTRRINQIQIQKLDMIACDAWLDDVCLTNGDPCYVPPPPDGGGDTDSAVGVIPGFLAMVAAWILM